MERRKMMTTRALIVKESLINIRNLNFAFGEGEARNQILFDINLDFAAGEVIVMTGPSGSGKTTLLTLIGALRSMQEGSLRVLEREYQGLSASEMVQARREIGFIFQLHNLFDSLTAMQNVKMPMDLKKNYTAKQKNTIAAEMLTKLGLGERLNYKPAALSGGQRQRVAIARALVNQPRIILADEPTAALDNETGRNVVKTLQSIAKEGRNVVIIVSHDSRVLDFADRIINMIDGRITTDVVVKESLELCQYLQKSKIFLGLTPAELSEVVYKMQAEVHEEGTEIIRQGESGSRFYMITKGVVDVFVDGEKSKYTHARKLFW